MTARGRGARKLPCSLLSFLLAPAVAFAGAPESHGLRCPKSSGAPPTRETVFTSEIRPILVAHCAPCHEPGGKLYAKLPFDDPAVLSSHEAGVKKRLKGDDLKVFERWLAMAPGKS